MEEEAKELANFVENFFNSDFKASEEELNKFNDILFSMIDDVNNNIMKPEHFYSFLDSFLDAGHITSDKKDELLTGLTLHNYMVGLFFKFESSDKLIGVELTSLDKILNIFTRQPDTTGEAKKFFELMLKNGHISSGKCEELIAKV
uniref:Uncharacterized protein n=1 Tax=Pithovirus LCPAC403 TaxID=2506596 RepID=A0A481ZBC0_9VIRU|nr:MAG: hypothetical protein LCPAC403_03570 [Pithovirus LCPAC403]